MKEPQNRGHANSKLCQKSQFEPQNVVNEPICILIQLKWTKSDQETGGRELKKPWKWFFEERERERETCKMGGRRGK